jgi:hypothetical protein
MSNGTFRHSLLNHYLWRARRVYHKLDKITGGKPTTYIEDVYLACEAYFNNGETGTKILDEEIIKMQKLQDGIRRYAQKVLQEAGAGKEWNEVNDIQTQVNVIISYLEEMLCEAMVDPKALIEAHCTHSLSYQRQ